MKSEEELIELLAKKSNKPKEEIEKLVQSKIEQFNGLISKKGAILIVAKELGVELSKKEAKEKNIAELEPWEYVKVRGIIRKNFGVKTYSKGKFQVILLEDNTGVIKVVIWNPSREYKEGEAIEVIGKVKVNQKTGKIEIHTDNKVKLLEEKPQITRETSRKSYSSFVGICIINYGRKQTQKGDILTKAVLSNIEKELTVLYFGDYEFEVGKIYKVLGRYSKDKKGRIIFIAEEVVPASLDELKSSLEGS